MKHTQKLIWRLHMMVSKGKLLFQIPLFVFGGVTVTIQLAHFAKPRKTGEKTSAMFPSIIFHSAPLPFSCRIYHQGMIWNKATKMHQEKKKHEPRKPFTLSHCTGWFRTIHIVLSIVMPYMNSLASVCVS